MTDIREEIEMAKAEYKDDIKELVKEMEAFRKEYQKKGQSVLKKAFKTFFNEHPDIKTITWAQYTPYFNDGDECIFSLKDAYCSKMKLTEADISDPYDLDGYEEDESDEVRLQGNGGYKYDSKQRRAVEKFMEQMSQLDDIFKELFDDHVWVIATEDGFEVHEYEHE